MATLITQMDSVNQDLYLYGVQVIELLGGQ